MMRVASIYALYILTGIIYSKQDGAGADGFFPTSVPTANDDTLAYLMLYPAACFEGNVTDFSALGSTLNDTFTQYNTFSAPQLLKTLQHSGPHNRIHGYTAWVIMMALFASAFCCSGIRSIFRPLAGRSQWWGRCSIFLWRMFLVLQSASCIASLGFVVNSYQYVTGMRIWMNNSGWMHLDEDGRNPEMDPSSFGQLLPVVLILLTIFQAAQALSGE